MRLALHVWRQPSSTVKGKFVRYEANDVSPDMSFLEMLDVINEELAGKGDTPIAFDHDCREGICGMCGVMINGVAHGPSRGTATCQLHMRLFKDGDEIWVEPWRSRAFPVIKDLVVDRGAFDRIIAAGGFVSVQTGSAPEANAIPVPKTDADRSMDAAACIGCGACVRRGVPKWFRLPVHGRQDVPPGPASAGPSRALPTRAWHGGADGPGALRRLLALWRMPGGVP